MRRQSLVVILVLGLVAVLAMAANADPWPSWDRVDGTYSCRVAKTQTATGYDYTVSVDPHGAYPDLAIGAFAVYADNVANQAPWFWWGYDGGDTAGWWPGTGWERNKYPGPHGTTAAFGWVTAGTLLGSGATATFHATNLPAGFENWSQHFAVLVAGDLEPGECSVQCVDLFWAPAEEECGDPPQETPEPGSLVLLTLGAGTMLGVVRRRKLS